ncbi:unnamed protein product [marine sediment metagenome]|uniref:Uncharacterized protein n=1 Tax=marine sediment metagenome TaxID=412755 RepID=X1AW97_9ZZZZ
MKILFVTPHNYNINSPLGCHHYARFFLSNGNQIFWLNRPISFLHLLKFKNNDFVKDNFKNWLNSGFKTNDGVFQYTPLTMLPYSHYVGLNNEWVLNRMLYFTIPLIKKY